MRFIQKGGIFRVVKVFLSRLIVFSSVWLLFTAQAVAATPTEAIKQTTDKVLSILTDPALKGPSQERRRRALIMEAVSERFDWERMSRSVLATHWASRTTKEKEDFTQLFSKLLESAYMDRVESYSGEKIYYDKQTVEGSYSTVSVRIVTKQGTEIPVKYYLIEERGEWLVYDIQIEGVSLIYNYRMQISSILNRSSFKDLVDELRAKVAGK
jgi:phospholipid transport system substrate-binding protein